MGKELHDCIAVGKEHGHALRDTGTDILPRAEGFCRTGKQKAIALDKKNETPQ